jgi:hypothetical protein
MIGVTQPLGEPNRERCDLVRHLLELDSGIAPNFASDCLRRDRSSVIVRGFAATTCRTRNTSTRSGASDPDVRRACR